MRRVKAAGSNARKGGVIPLGDGAISYNGGVAEVRDNARDDAAGSRRYGILIHNPTSGRRRQAAALRGVAARAARDGLELAIVATTARGDATELARRAVANGASVVAVCGGDGTVNEAVCGLTGSAVPLVLLPAGTANVLARELEIPRDLAAAARLLVTGIPVALSLGVAGNSRFVMMAGFGLDARIMQGSPFGKPILGRLAYAARAAVELARWRCLEIVVRADGREVRGTAAIAANIRRYGGNFVLAPDADPRNGLLDIVIFQGRSRFDYFRYALGLAAGRHTRFRDVVVLRVPAATVESASGEPIPCQLDGDAVLTTPVSLGIETDAFRVLVPAGSRYA